MNKSLELSNVGIVGKILMGPSNRHNHLKCIAELEIAKGYRIYSLERVFYQQIKYYSLLSH